MAKPNALAMPEKIDGRRPRPHAANDRRPAAEKHQRESPDKFGYLLVHSVPSHARARIAGRRPYSDGAGVEKSARRGSRVRLSLRSSIRSRRCFRGAARYICDAFS